MIDNEPYNYLVTVIKHLVSISAQMGARCQVAGLGKGHPARALRYFLFSACVEKGRCLVGDV